MLKRNQSVHSKNESKLDDNSFERKRWRSFSEPPKPSNKLLGFFREAQSCSTPGSVARIPKVDDTEYYDIVDSGYDLSKRISKHIGSPEMVIKYKQPSLIERQAFKEISSEDEEPNAQDDVIGLK